MKIPKRRLGRSDLKISAVGFGAWAIGGGDWEFGWGTQDDAQSVAAVHHAVELGVNWIDTAPIYGLGHSEEVIGSVLREIAAAERPLVFTKCGVIWDGSEREVDLRRTLRPDTLRAEVQASLRRLGVERIDLLQVHQPPDAESTPIEESWAEMARLVDEGVVRAIGVSNFDLGMLERCESVRHVDSLQVPFSLIRREVAVDILPWCAARQISIIPYSPMQAGLLTEGFSLERVRTLAAGDWRRRNRYFQPPRLESNLALRDALRPLAQRLNTSLAALAVAWTLAWPGVTGAVVGARSPQQIDGWIAGGSLDLSGADLDEIAQAIESTGAGDGPVRPPLGALGATGLVGASE